MFRKLDVLLPLPYMRDIIGYLDDSYTERKTLFDVTTSLRTEYVQIMSTEYETIQSLFSLSILQAYCAKNVVTRKLPLDIFLQATLQLVKDTLRAAIKISGLFSQNAKQFDFVVSVIERNINEVEITLHRWLPISSLWGHSWLPLAFLDPSPPPSASRQILIPQRRRL